MKTIDFVIIGGGVFGLYAARLLKNQYSVLVIDRDPQPCSRASYVNQARLHNGYHYPRSIETAVMSHDKFYRFAEEYAKAIYSTFDQVYAIALKDSKTNAQEYVDFCAEVDIPLDEIDHEKYFIQGSVEAAWITKETTFDPEKLRDLMLVDASDCLQLSTEVIGAVASSDGWDLLLSTGESIHARNVINTTYASINQVNALFSVDPITVKYELCEMVLCNVCDNLKDVGITVMDGPFFSVMPFGLQGHHSLAAVQHTPHVECKELYPRFPCQDKDSKCNNRSLSNCNSCTNKPATAYDRMNDVVKQFLPSNSITSLYSIYAIKAIDLSAEDDDSRVTTGTVGSENPFYLSVLSGKVNCIYELEHMLRRFL